MDRASSTNPRSGKDAFPPPLNLNKRSPPPTTSNANTRANEKPTKDNAKAKSNPKTKGQDAMDDDYVDVGPVSPGAAKAAPKASTQYSNNFSKADARFSTAAQSSYGAFDPLDYAASEAPPPLPTEKNGETSEELRQRRLEEKQRREEEWEEEQAQRKRERERLAQERRQKEIQEEEERRRREWAEEDERRRRREEEEDFDEEIPRRQSPPRQEQYQRRPSGADRRNSYARHSFHRQNDSRDYRRYNSNSNSNNNSGNEEENSRGDPRRERININMNDAWQSWTSMGGRDDRGGFGMGGTPGFGLFGGQRAGFGPVGNLPITQLPGLGGFRMFGLMSFNTQPSTPTSSTGQQSGPQSSPWRADAPSRSPDQAGDALFDANVSSSPQQNTWESSPEFASLLATAAAITQSADQAQLTMTGDVDVDSDANTSSDDEGGGSIGSDESTGATAMPETLEELATYSDDVIAAHAALLPYLAGRLTSPGLYLQLARVAFLRQGRERPQSEPPRVEVDAGTVAVGRGQREQSLGMLLMRHKLLVLEKQSRQQQPQQQEQGDAGGQDMDVGLWDWQEYQGHGVSGDRVDEDGDVEMEDAWL
ncbi:hypothetical protein PpBr36_05049 [Pyricularia pennisetigena]|uniref:hypothetical protein n=1 Tax=Pyricularia pennisetigena TaxID=1578925 RepID=UPI00114F6B81|nr:hypothetical protein PpBr36_05049 [Pyricularia pennisetigena]TLS26226.1 hypothetical protein PpBr36_05049 [Pyricularia pennisetigena]